MSVLFYFPTRFNTQNARFGGCLGGLSHAHNGVRLLWVVLLLCLSLCSAATESRAAPAVSFSKPFTYYAAQQALPVVLMEFARSQGLGASIAPGVTGTMSGRFNNVPPQTFLSGLRSAFGVNWYRLGSNLHFYNEADVTRTFISPRAMSATRLYSMLQQSSVFSPQLQPTMGPNGSMIVVTGPPDYIAQVTNAVTAFEEAQTTNVVMKVFPLKYAWAEDISVNSMDKTVMIPGVASILRSMVTGSPNSATRITQSPATVDKLSGTGLIAQGRQEPLAGSPIVNTQQPPIAQASQNQGPLVNIMADPRVNSVIIHDAEYRMPYYAKVIEDLDKPVELVEIHAAIVDIDTNFKRDLGVTYQAANPDSRGWGYGGELSPTTSQFNPLPSPGTAAAGLSLSTIYTMGSDFFLARIQALEEDGEARMLGRPSVLTVDNVQATLENTSTYYIQVQGYQAVDLFKIEAGTVLRVTPHIIHDEKGQMSIKLAVSVQDDQNDTKSSSAMPGTLPPIKQTKINTQAIVGAGQSLLIGGYYYEQKATTENGIPVLMNIPLLGHLFKTTSKTTKRMERLILITPKVIKLNELPPTPDRLDEPSFRRTPTQADYTERLPVAGSGCTSKTTRLEEPVQALTQEKPAAPLTSPQAPTGPRT